MKNSKGYVYFDEERGAHYARVTFTDNAGKRKDIKKRVENKSEGDKLLRKLINTYDNTGLSGIQAEALTFNDLADYYEKHYAQPAQYVNGRKISGLRSVAAVRGYVKVFRERFGRRKLKSLTYEDLCKFRLDRLTTSTHQSKQRGIATVNREMAYLRRMLNIAERAEMIAKNPFKRGDALIHTGDEVKRERILSRHEEARLLAACTGCRAHLRPIVIAALDTGCRLGELLKLRWSDIDQVAGIITIQAFNTKTMRERQVSITTRLNAELENLWNASDKQSDALVFGVKSTICQAFRKVCDEVGLEGFRGHDLRHTHATRLDDMGFSLAKIGAQLGHTQVQTTLRYVNRDKTAIKQVASALDAFNAEAPDRVADTQELIN